MWCEHSSMTGGGRPLATLGAQNVELMDNMDQILDQKGYSVQTKGKYYVCVYSILCTFVNSVRVEQPA